jgi:hypothetical protein
MKQNLFYLQSPGHALKTPVGRFLDLVEHLEGAIEELTHYDCSDEGDPERYPRDKAFRTEFARIVDKWANRPKTQLVRIGAGVTLKLLAGQELTADRDGAISVQSIKARGE